MDKKKNDLLIKQLQSDNQPLVLDTIELLREEGNNDLLLPLATLYTSTQDKLIKEKIFNFFCDLRNQDSAVYIINLLKLKDLETIKEMLLSTCWQSRINYSEFLEFFIDLVYTEPFSIAFEAFTVIESLESKFSSERKDELITYVKSKITLSHNNNKALIQELIPIIEQYDE